MFAAGCWNTTSRKHINNPCRGLCLPMEAWEGGVKEDAGYTLRLTKSQNRSTLEMKSSFGPTGTRIACPGSVAVMANMLDKVVQEIDWWSTDTTRNPVQGKICRELMWSFAGDLFEQAHEEGINTCCVCVEAVCRSQTTIWRLNNDFWQRGSRGCLDSRKVCESYSMSVVYLGLQKPW